MTTTKLYSIEGNNGSGKSLLLETLSEIPGILVVREPSDLWVKTGILQKFYEDPKKYEFMFQSYILATRAKAISDTMKLAKKSDIVIVERSALLDHECFIKGNYEIGNLTDLEYKILCEMYEIVLGKLYSDNNKLSGMIYLKTDPKTCLSRVKIRGRESENTMSLEYLQMLDARHTNYLSKQSNILIIDGNIDKKQFGDNIKKIIGFIGI
jgi:deoxyadenosine/deoxycytidine kinase